MTISVNGSVGTLYPGAAPEPLDLSLTNSTGSDVSITGLTVTLDSITLAADPPSPGTCTANDFAIQQFSGALPFTVGAGQTVTLSGLGFPVSQLPTIAMVDQPYDQDGCEGATLNLDYTGTGS